MCSQPSKRCLFQSTLPAGGATWQRHPVGDPPGNFNPRSPQGERRPLLCHCTGDSGISIHAPRRGSDVVLNISVTINLNFNPRSPQGERPDGHTLETCSPQFQSTLPAGGATPERKKRWGLASFQSTLPAGGATLFHPDKVIWMGISIHAPRRGSDRHPRPGQPLLDYFNPRSPQGERRGGRKRKTPQLIFQSTLPAGGATCATWNV